MLVVLLLIASVGARNRDAIWFPDEWKAIVGGQEALAPPEDDPVSYVILEDQWARVGGLREGHFPNSYYRFLGLRYAEPPVGPLRFQRPRVTKLSGDLSARRFGAHCPQPHPNDPNRITGSEDCLFLNVFTPKLPDDGPLLPVLVWIHGGGFRRGSGAQYGGGFLARRDLVVVTPNYRLGALGFLSAQDPHMPGNAALFDLAAVLTWVRHYIAFFGGDPERIIPFGQGTGGSSAALLALSNITQGRMAGVISMSGSATSPFAIDSEPGDVAHTLAQQNGCPLAPTVAMVKCLQQLPVEKLVKADTTLEEMRAAARGLSGMGAALSPAPVVESAPDGRSLPPYLGEAPSTSLEWGRGAHIPLLTGVTKHETAAAVTGGYRSKILDGLTNIPNFIETVVIKELTKQTAERIEQSAKNLGKILTAVTSNYRNPGSLADGLNQIIEATSDALFNYPAYQQSSAWVKRKLPTFFYNFEHSGRLRGAAKLLMGSPLVYEDPKQQNEMQAVSHGSDLPYIFDVRDLDGTPDPEINETTILHPEDQATRDNFLSLFEQFAKKGVVEVDRKVLQFPNFISIDSTSRAGANFRECNMALWSGSKPKESCPRLQVLTSQVVENLGKLFGEAQNVFGKFPPGPKLNLTLPSKPILTIPGFG